MENFNDINDTISYNTTKIVENFDDIYCAVCHQSCNITKDQAKCNKCKFSKPLTNMEKDCIELYPYCVICLNSLNIIWLEEAWHGKCDKCKYQRQLTDA